MNFIAGLLVLTTSHCYAMTFSEAVKKLENHPSVEALAYKSAATLKNSNLQSSWGDPHFRISAKNYPQNFKNDQSPMTGIEFQVSQKIPITTKYGNIKSSLNALSRAHSHQTQNQENLLTKSLWEILIHRRRINAELNLLKENKAWINKILKISKKLYANGKISQQAILDIQIRNSEIDIAVSKKKYQLDQIKEQITYLVGQKSIHEDSIPWNILKNRSHKATDSQELQFKERLKSRELNLIAAKLNRIPDLTFSLGVTKRSNIDENGDFIGASLSFPLPLSSEKYSKHGQAVQEKQIAIKNYENYKKLKSKNIAVLKNEISQLQEEMSTLTEKTIKFAKNSRSITSKSYGLGRSSYTELLQSELKLQKFLEHTIKIEAQRDLKQVMLKYILGEPLNE